MSNPHEQRTLILVPTELELDRFEKSDARPFASQMELCGFGPIAAAARTAQLLGSHCPSRVVLVGIAGTYDPQTCPVGSASEFDSVSVFGIGVGCGDEHVPNKDLGFAQWASVMDTLPLRPSSMNGTSLLTCCAASASTVDVQQRRQLFPAAIAEDMEGFGVALACQLADVPLTIIRGISNVAGDRDKSRWQIDEAVEAAGRQLKQNLEND